MSTALIVVDVQNDFCAGFDEVVRAVGRAVEAAREAAIEVIFVRFVGDVEHQRTSWRRRNRLQGKTQKCVDGTWGAEFRGVAPLPGEHVFTKAAHFDAFLCEGFEEHLRLRRVGHLAFAGLYTDVCVDSTARTGFQKGWHVTLLTDCTASLHLPADQIQQFMARFYGARLLTHDDPAWTRPPDEEESWPAMSG
jgi:nicotinamidase-related amidase